MIIWSSLTKYAIMLLSVAGIIGGAYWYHNDMQNRIESLSAESERRDLQLRQVRAELQQTQEDYEMTRKREQELARQAREAETYSNELLQLLRRHDLTALTRARPGLIQIRVNNATEEIFKELESITATVD